MTLLPAKPIAVFRRWRIFHAAHLRRRADPFADRMAYLEHFRMTLTFEQAALVEAARSEAARNGANSAYAWRARELCGKLATLIETQAAEIAALRTAMHEIDVEAANTIPPDGKQAAFAALERITRIINPFRATRNITRESE